MHHRFFVAALGVLFSAASLAGQCAPGWTSAGVNLSNGNPFFPTLADALELVDTNGSAPGGEAVFVGGQFSTAGGVAATNIARLDRDTGTWSGLGAGLPFVNVSAIHYVSDTEIYAAGVDFLVGTPTVRRFDGASWTILGSFSNSPFRNVVFDLDTLPNGDLIVGGGFSMVAGVTAENIARFDGTTWSPLGAGLPGEEIRVLHQLPNGDLLVGAQITQLTSTGAWTWDGTTWTPAFVGTTGQSIAVGSLVPLGNGEFLAGGGFDFPGLGTTRDTVARWDGSDWRRLGSGILRPQNSSFATLAVAHLPDGSFLAGGFFPIAGGVTANNVARFDGSTWQAVGAGIGNGPATNDQVFRFALGADGIVFATSVGVPTPSPGALARLDLPCGAATSTIGSPGQSPSGPVSLAATQTPYLGGSFVVESQGFAPGDNITAVYGLPLAPLPLSAIVAQGLPGNSLLVDLVATAPVPLTGGTAVSSAAVPATPSLIGGQVTVQMLAIRPGGPGGFSLFGSNAVRGTIGTY